VSAKDLNAARGMQSLPPDHPYLVAQMQQQMQAQGPNQGALSDFYGATGPGPRLLGAAPPFRQDLAREEYVRAGLLGQGIYRQHPPAELSARELAEIELGNLCPELREPDPVTPRDVWYVRAWISLLRFILRLLPEAAP
jgi:hypothetical protein